MNRFIDRLTLMTRKELIYLEGFLAMQRERYAEYERDLKAALAADDRKRVGEIGEDLHAFRREIAHLEGKRASAVDRLERLGRDERFPAMAVRLRGTDRRVS
jgi:hypothetical protein